MPDVPIYTTFNYISPGPHITDKGKIDPRVWFSIQIRADKETGAITSLVFPYGGTEDEIKEEVLDLAALLYG